ncbi:MAG: sulfate ABC transporter substrate-binding protein [Lachnospiraceae bacterium]|nr:sulfate ABC transporter substrate-binding protein [Lachnospiraceae bacterium]
MKIENSILKKITKGAAILFSAGLIITGLTGCGSSSSSASSAKKGDTIELTNVSYDPTRELYQEYNKVFADYYKKKTGKTVNVTMSHGGSGGQARSVIEGNKADVVTLALEHDITAIQEAGLIDEGWLKEFDKDSSPYTSTIVFLVRKGNPKGIKDWDDLIKDGVQVITPDPKTSGGACWNFLAAWAYFDSKESGDTDKVKEDIGKLYKNVLVLDSGARKSTNTFVENGQGDVLLAWENEAYLSMKEHPDDYEIISPSVSILAQPSVAIVDKNAKSDGVEEVAHDYLEYLYSDEAQEIAAKNFYRPSNKEILEKYKDQFDLNMNLVTINDFGGWDQAFKDYFQDGAIFDQIYSKE